MKKMQNSQRIRSFLFGKISRGDIEDGIITKIKRVPKRTGICRLILSVERTTFKNKENAAIWDFCSFNYEFGSIYKKEERGNFRLLEEWRISDYQYDVLREIYPEGFDPVKLKRTDVQEVDQSNFF